MFENLCIVSPDLFFAFAQTTMRTVEIFSNNLSAFPCAYCIYNVLEQSGFSLCYWYFFSHPPFTSTES